MRRHAERLVLDHSHFSGQRRWTEAELADAIAAAGSWAQVVTALGLSGGSSETTLKGHAARLGIDVQHLRRGQPPPPTGAVTPMNPQPAQLPRAGALLAAAWFTLCGYQVSWPLEPCRYDLLAGLNDDFLRVQVKTTRVKKSGGWPVTRSTTRGVRLTYDPDDIDYFFVVDGDIEYYLIPIAAVGGMHTISLSGYAQYRLPRELLAAT